MGYHFWIFVITASYIANLANIYIANEKIRLGISTIDDANTQSANVCVMTGGGNFKSNTGVGRCFDCYNSGTPYDIANLTYASAQLVSINSGDSSTHPLNAPRHRPPPPTNFCQFTLTELMNDRGHTLQTTPRTFFWASTTDLAGGP